MSESIWCHSNPDMRCRRDGVAYVALLLLLELLLSKLLLLHLSLRHGQILQLLLLQQLLLLNVVLLAPQRTMRRTQDAGHSLKEHTSF